MKRSPVGLWWAGTLVLVVLVLFGTYALVVSPRTEAAAQSRQQAEDISRSNAVIRNRIDRLAEQAAGLDDVRAEIRDLQVGIPGGDEQASLIREISEAARTSAIFLANIEMADPELVGATDVPTASVDPNAPVAGDGGDSGVEAGAEEAADAAAAAAGGDAVADEADGAEESDGDDGDDVAGAPLVPGFYQIPVTVTAYGDNTEVKPMIAGLQNMTRYFLVTRIVIERQDPAPPTGGLPAMEEGDVMLLVEGYVYVLVDDDPTTWDGEEPEAPVAPGPLPVDPGTRNPFAIVVAPAGEGAEGDGEPADAEGADAQE